MKPRCKGSAIRGPNCSGNGEIPSEEELTSHQSGNRDETNDAHLVHRGELLKSLNRIRGVCQLCDLRPQGSRTGEQGSK